MKTLRLQKSWFALLALLLILGACKGESPTAPPSGGGGTPPPTGANVTLTASTTTPLVDSTVTFTATVTVNGAPAPNGTAVEFTANGGGFDGTTVQSILKTTTNGVATVSLTSSVAGPVRVTAVVNNVSRSVDVTFQTKPVVEPPASTAPSISSVAPTLGRPAGGETIRITGKNFKTPVRVLFDIGQALPIEAFVANVTDTTIDVITPAVNVGAGQQLVADVIVLTQAGTANEQRVESDDAFTFRNEVLEPRIATATPNSGPVTGGTRVSIFGDGFQAPVQVLFGAAEARVITVQFGEIIVETPAARDTGDSGSGTVFGPVDITVLNINSQKAATFTGGFRYVAALDITSVRPTIGPATGGTDVTIDGIGFVAPVDVTIGGVRATVLRVSGTQILARTGSLPSPCSTGAGFVQVVNVANGDTEIYGDDVTEQGFGYVAVNPLITSVTPAAGVSPGGALTVSVRDPGVGPLGSADVRFTMNGRTIIPSPSSITIGDGTTTFGVTVPTSGFTFPTVACTTTGGLEGERLGTLDLPLQFANLTTGCTDITTVIIQPPTPNACLSSPNPAVTTPAGGSCATPGTASLTGVGFPSTTQANIVISNAAESQPLSITGVTVSGSNASEFTVSPTTATGIAAGGSQTFTLTFDPTTTGAKDATVTFTTNSTIRPTLTVCVQTTAAP